MTKVFFNGQEIAAAPTEDLLHIEGNLYFPDSSLKKEYFSTTDYHTVCPWKGDASYYTITVGDKSAENAAWYYPIPKEGSVEKVGKDFANYVAFYTDKVEIREE